jgi:alkylation response protein AidB-like acyl-CoA dehydrogenase
MLAKDELGMAIARPTGESALRVDDGLKFIEGTGKLTPLFAPAEYGIEWRRRGKSRQTEDMDDQLADGAERLFAAHAGKDVLHAAERGGFPEGLWRAVTEAGFAAALLPEEAGGFGTTTAEAARILQIAAAHAAPIPLGETMLAGWLIARAGLPVPPGALTLAPVRKGDKLTLRRLGGRWRLSGSASRIPWARHAAAIAVLAEADDEPRLVLLRGGGFTATPDLNLAGEPRDMITVDAQIEPDDVAHAPQGFGKAELRAAGAAVRTAQIAGALSRVLAMSAAYAQTRVQFGRPIAKFQAIQQNLAVLAGHCAAAMAASDMAAEALRGRSSPFFVGAAKARAGESAGIAAGLAHQLHGAIGFTQEYGLHHLTKRLWSWREEFGNEAEWNASVGRAALAAGPEGLWPALTAQ